MIRVLGVLIGLVALPVWGADWPQWFGPDRDGKSAETGLARQWPEGGPALLWKTTGLGPGYSSFAVVDGRIYTQGQRGNRQFIMVFDLETGEKLWEVANGTEYLDETKMGDGPRGAPTVDGDRLYALGGNGRLICLDLNSREEVWAVDLFSRFNTKNLKWGISESPLVDGERLIVFPGGPEVGMVSLDKRTGEVVWTSEPDKAGYSSAKAVQIGDLRQYVILSGTAAVGVRAEDGKLLWRYEKVANRVANIATPVVRGDYAFFSSDYGTGCVLLKLTGDGKAEEAYFNKDMRNHYSTSVLVGDHLYGYNSGIFTCMEFKTGEVAWKHRSVGKGQVVFADGLLYLFSEEGVVGLAEPSPEEYREISRFEIPHGDVKTWTLPVISDGRLLLRDQDNLFCFDVRAR